MSVFVNAAQRLVAELDATCRAPVFERGQVKAVWREALRILLDEYRRRFHEEFQ